MAKLVWLSRHFGGNPEFILAGGGNTSAKIGGRLYVKASGHSLAGIDEGGFVATDREKLAALLLTELSSDPARREAEFKEAILTARAEGEKGLRPSVECVLHNVLAATFVVHTHSTWANMIACSTQGERIARELFGDEVLWVPYVDPGYVLARRLAAALEAYAKRTKRAAPAAVLMESHGLIVADDDPEEIIRRTEWFVEKVRQRVGDIRTGEPFGAIARIEEERSRKLIEVIAPALRGLLAEGRSLKVVTFDDSDVVMNLAAGTDGAAVAAGGAIAPDEIVYCKAFAMWFEAAGDEATEALVARLRTAVEAHKAATRFAPSVVIVKGLGIFAAGDDFAAADTARVVYVDAIKVMAGARRLGGIKFLSERDREFIENWELEVHRRRVAAGESRKGRVAGKVAVVTGAAQGFGFEIAKDLVKEGAHVALTDINADGVAKAGAALSEGAGAGRVMAAGIDVTKGESVAQAVHEVVRRYGGFDIFVSNAGVLRAGSVKTQPQAEFEFVTSVNYVGYFVCVQKAAPVMAVQHLAKGDYTSDIIQVNSKSGLAGSNRNSAYAGSKFGGIGLTQSFALELIEDGIKVNAVCPGNFFDGPLWSDPESGLFAQYLRSGKVPGARTLADVRRAYEAKVPMGRGCTAADVMKAIYYAVEQEYETGQAIPVTGGQVMLS
jgi:rhamnose utilization protein RhaD (predicted bifunctional aldolase and dehydrogenase)/NAD(P)-dependent dehydrogenase (short-subunit alcohol dehydrogenase family)